MKIKTKCKGQRNLKKRIIGEVLCVIQNLVAFNEGLLRKKSKPVAIIRISRKEDSLYFKNGGNLNLNGSMKFWKMDWV